MTIPQTILELIQYLNDQGFAAYLVGGAVRDQLLGVESHDYDLATDGTPNELIELFPARLVDDRAARFGSLRILIEPHPVVLTTFRSEASYSDHRHPDRVVFTSSLKEDLKRRDYTINAIAWHPEKGFVDPFSGYEDIRSQILRTVGNPAERLSEDPLRILRGLRFMARFRLTAEPLTHKYLINMKDLLFTQSPDRIGQEIAGLIQGEKAGQILVGYGEIVEAILPRLSEYRQSPHWKKSCLVVDKLPSELTLRLAGLLHDIALAQGKDGHAERGDEMARQVLRDLRANNQTILAVSQLVRYHDAAIAPTAESVREWLSRLGQEMVEDLLILKQAIASASDDEEAMVQLKKTAEQLQLVLHGKIAYSLANLAVNGKDLKAHGFREGIEIGLILERLLREVMDEKLPNEKTALIDRAYQLR